MTPGPFSSFSLSKELILLQESIETIVACSAMALQKEKEAEKVSQSPKSSWAKWKRGGIIGGAALAGGTLLAVTGGMAIFYCSILSFAFICGPYNFRKIGFWIY